MFITNKQAQRRHRILSAQSCESKPPFGRLCEWLRRNEIEQFECSI